MEKTAEHTHTHDHDHEHPHDHHHSHTHTHDPEHIRRILNRFSRSIGHLDSVRRMVERGEDCADVLVQLAAVRGEINKISQLILKEHLDHCILDAMETHDHEAIEKLNEAIDKLMR
ncbi:MAG: metal-sensing transcriptional repressor [Erysipelotrichaceae bacterium]|nr:metal-sensing transcriptional repressor [Erysipelotrichaceae bacterium]